MSLFRSTLVVTLATATLLSIPATKAQARVIIDVPVQCGFPLIALSSPEVDGVQPLFAFEIPGSSPDCPLLPDAFIDGVFSFTFDTTAWQEDWADFPFVWFDPPVVTSYDYAITGAEFLGVQLPPFGVVPQVGDYTVTDGTNSVDVGPDAEVDFTAAPFGGANTFFTIANINAALGLDPTDDQAFPVGLNIGGFTGQSFTVTITPGVTTSVIPLPGAGLLYLGALGLALGAGGALRRRRQPA